MDISKYPIVTTIKEVSKEYDIQVDLSGKSETSSLTKYLDGSIELEYTYDLIETDFYTPLFYSITITKDKTIKDAKENYKLSNDALGLVVNSFGQGTEEVTNMDLPGDENYYANRTYDGAPNGFLFSMREGVYSYSLIVSGIYMEDNSFIYDVILPEIQNLKDFDVME
ncbi:hypothetical protein [uncultured Maribacter sp.]|uniref:hypothetical protein n=1 Tax=uncultured Maribacter sp. TaxID=431308 RepID=UPI002627297E|nr:hypothetical protein [uncultured Maribacter sp.]